MFHQRSSVSFGGDSSSQNVNVMRSSHHQNENLVRHRNNPIKPSASNNISKNNSFGNDTMMGGKKPIKGLSKTPHGKNTSTRRRAFGDISNTKTNNNNGFGKEQSSSLKQRNSQQKEILKPRSNNLLPRSARKVQTTKNARFAILPEQPKDFRSEGSLNNRNTIEHKSISTTIAQVKNHHIRKLDPVPDIERPAGRTWKQQLEYDLKDEDDLASISSMDSLLNLKSCFSPQERWEKERVLIWNHQREMDDEEDRQVKEQIQAMMDREQKQAEDELDCLYDAIDNLEIFSESSHDSKHDDLSGFDLSLPDDLTFPL